MWWRGREEIYVFYVNQISISCQLLPELERDQMFNHDLLCGIFSLWIPAIWTPPLLLPPRDREFASSRVSLFRYDVNCVVPWIGRNSYKHLMEKSALISWESFQNFHFLSNKSSNSGCLRCLGCDFQCLPYGQEELESFWASWHTGTSGIGGLDIILSGQFL